MEAGTVWIIGGVLLMLAGAVMFVIAQVVTGDRIRSLENSHEFRKR